MNIVGITPGHNSSVALVKDGKVEFFIEEDRLSRSKYDNNPLKALYYLLENYVIDEIVISGISEKTIPTLWKKGEIFDIYTGLVKKYNPKVVTTLMYNHHHLTHAANAFYNSGFKKSIIIVADHSGSVMPFKTSHNNEIEVQEVETIFEASFPNNFKTIYQSLFSFKPYRLQNENLKISDALNITRCYQIVTKYLGFRGIEAGKTMGLSSYGNPNNNLPKLFKYERGDRYIFYRQDGQEHLNFKRTPDEITQLGKDLSYNMQIESQELIGDLVQKGLNKSKINNVCIVGGYGLNCVANYYMLKRFPNVNFYHEPLAHDAGNSLGAALYRWYELTQNPIINPQKTLYYGPKYSKQELLKEIKKYVDN